MVNALRLCAIGMLLNVAVSAAGPGGIWMGQIEGRNKEKQDIAFQFKPGKDQTSGVMFGDEFDLPVQDLSVEGDHISFSVTSINFYDGRRIKFVFRGTINGKEMQLTRERTGAQVNAAANKREPGKQTFTLKRLD